MVTLIKQARLSLANAIAHNDREAARSARVHLNGLIAQLAWGV
jgi:hypothetical protein